MRSLLSESDEPTILHTHFTSFDIPAAMAAGGHAAAKVFWHVHTPHHDSLPMRARNRLKYSVLGRRVERILCVSSELAEVVVDRGAPRSRVEFMHNAVDVDRFRLLEREEREIARLRLGLPADQPLLVHFGWDWHRKGGDLFLHAMRALRERGRRGGGPHGRRRRAGQAASRRARARPRGARARPDRRCPVAVRGRGRVHVAEPRRGHALFRHGGPLQRHPGGRQRHPGPRGHGRAESPRCPITPHDAGAIADAAQELIDREPHEVSADALAAHLWMRENLHLPRWSAGLVDRYEHALGLTGARRRQARAAAGLATRFGEPGRHFAGKLTSVSATPPSAAEEAADSSLTARQGCRAGGMP